MAKLKIPLPAALPRPRDASNRIILKPLLPSAPSSLTSSELLSRLYASLPLPTGPYIRVLTIRRASDPTKLKLIGTLSVVHLRECPSFAALSYVWGSNRGPTHSVICNGIDVPITHNCYQALKAIVPIARDSDLGSGDAADSRSTIWVDAVCINQADDSEKSSQIPLMQDIYTYARAVYIWLGPASEASERAMSQIIRAKSFNIKPPGIPWKPDQGLDVRYIQSRAKWVWLWQSSFRLAWLRLGRVIRAIRGSFIKELRHIRSRLLMQTSTEPQGDPLEDLDELLSSEWLERAWTFQEIILASNPVIVRGDRSINFGNLQMGIRFQLGIEYRPVSLPSWGFPFAHDAQGHIGTPAVQSWIELFQTWSYIRRPTGPLSSRWGDCEAGRHIGMSVCHLQSLYFHGKRLTVASDIVLTIASMALECILGFFGFLVPVVVYFIMAVMFLAIKRRGELLDPYVAFELDEDSSLPLISVLHTIRSRNLSDQRDRAYAAYGVLQSLGVQLSPSDYTLSRGQVYHRLMTDLLRWKPSLICLLVDVGFPALPDAPSWVPDWSSLQQREWLPPRKLYAAIVNAESSPDLTMSGPQLGIRGKRLCSIQYASGPIQHCECRGVNCAEGDRCTLGAGFQSIAGWANAIGRNPSARLHYSSIAEASMEVLSGYDDGLMITPNDFGSWYLELMNYQGVPSSFIRSPSTSQFSINHNNDRFYQAADRHNITINYINQLAGKRGLFCLTDGRIGSGAPGASENDVVFLLEGMATPVVLRPTGTAFGMYHVLGPAHVCGYTGESAATARGWENVTLV